MTTPSCLICDAPGHVVCVACAPRLSAAVAALRAEVAAERPKLRGQADAATMCARSLERLARPDESLAWSITAETLRAAAAAPCPCAGAGCLRCRGGGPHAEQGGEA